MAQSPFHTPVMLNEMLEHLSPQDNDHIIDGTFGAGGYSRAILETAKCNVYGIDQDPDTTQHADRLAKEFSGRWHFLQGNFSDMESLITSCYPKPVDGIVLDIGVSSMQLDQSDRGFSFMHDGPLDMRMSQDGETAADIVNTYPENQLADIIYQYGEERKSRQIARKIIEARTDTPITRTRQLTQLIHSVIKQSRAKIDPATKTFQALRIYLNDELGALQKALFAAEKLLAPGGRLVVVTFHSLEDTIVKQFINKACGTHHGVNRHIPVEPQLNDGQADSTSTFTRITRKAVKPSKPELERNPRARSAKLRAAKRTHTPPRLYKEALWSE